MGNKRNDRTANATDTSSSSAPERTSIDVRHHSRRERLARGVQNPQAYPELSNQQLLERNLEDDFEEDV